MIRTKFRVPRYISGPLGPFTLTVDGISCRLSLERDPPRNPVPAGGAEGSGAVVTVEHEPTADMGDEELVAEALQLSLTATNRVVHALAFSSARRGVVPLLDGVELEDLMCSDLSGAAPRPLPTAGLLPRRPVRIKSEGERVTEEVQAAIDPLPSEFATSDDLWRDAVQAFYAGGMREAVVFARAAIEVAWETAARSAAFDLARQVNAPVQASIFGSYVDEALEARSLKDQFNKYSKALFGFSFESDWDAAKWGKLTTFFELRNRIAHEGFRPPADDAWSAIDLTREVLTKLVELRGRAVPPAPAAGARG